MVKYRYRPLGTNRQFRVLTLKGGSSDSPLICSIEHHELPPKVDYATIPDKSKPKPVETSTSALSHLAKPEIAIKYEALSWTWGDETPESYPVLHIEDGDAKSELDVQPNIYDALKQLRLQSDKRSLWIDAVCIEQHKDREKNLQVAMMADIYSHAQNVCIWLGSQDESSDQALDFISNQVSDIGKFEEITSDAFAKEWVALGALMIRPWFSRRWVVQEIALARNATVHCGDRMVNWREFETAVALFERDAATISKFYRGSVTTHHDHDLFGEVAATGAARLVRAKSNLFRHDDHGRIIEYRSELGELVADLSSFDAKKPHDMVYAILALAKDTYMRTTALDPTDAVTEPTNPVPFGNESTAYPTVARAGSSTTSAERSLIAVADKLSGQTSQTSTGPVVSVPSSEFSRTTDSSTPEITVGSPSSAVSRKRPLETTTNTITSASSHPPRATSSGPSRKKPKVLDTAALSPARGTTPEKSPTMQSVVKVFKRAIEHRNARIFQVDYNLPFFEVCKQFLAFTIPKTERHNLDILCRPWAPKVPTTEKLPSWIPSVEKAAFGRRKAEHAPGGYQTARKNPDPLVGLASQYNACKSPKAYYDNSDPSKGDWYFGGEAKDRRLFVTGFALDKVGHLSTYCQNGDIPMEWLEMGGWNPWSDMRPGKPASNVPNPPDRLWRTLVADRGPDGVNASIYYPEVFKYAVLHSTEENGLETSALSTRHNALLVEFLKRMKAVVWKRRMFSSEQHDLLGVAPMEAAKGDGEFYRTAAHALSAADHRF